MPVLSGLLIVITTRNRPRQRLPSLLVTITDPAAAWLGGLAVAR
jgi:hypothetical protein